MAYSGMKHPDENVNRAITQLCDALCDWERATGRESVLIIREQGDFVFRAASGKPNVPNDVSDAEIVSILLGEARR
jgi:hypothetical protein